MKKDAAIQYLRDQEEFIRELLKEIENDKPITYAFMVDLPMARRLESEEIQS